MRQLLFWLLLFSLIACKSRQKYKDQKSELSQWVEENQFKLSQSLDSFISKNYNHPEAGSTTVSKSLWIGDSTILGDLTNKIRTIDSNVIFNYLYHPNKKKRFSLSLSSGGNRATVKTIDSIFSDIDSLDDFNLYKYSPALANFSGLSFQNYNGTTTNLLPKEISFELIKKPGNMYNIYVINKNISQTIAVDITQMILGEEVVLKSIDSILAKPSSTNSQQFSIEQVQNFFKVKT